MAVTPGGSGYFEDQVWVWTSARNPDIAVETPGSENYEWVPTIPADYGPHTAPDPLLYLGETPRVSTYHGISDFLIELSMFPVPVSWAVALKNKYSLTNLNSIADWDNYDLEETPLVINGWAVLTLDGNTWPVDMAGVPTIHLYIKEDLTGALLYATSVHIATEGTLAADMAAANPGGFSAGELTFTWSINNGT